MSRQVGARCALSCRAGRSGRRRASSRGTSRPRGQGRVRPARQWHGSAPSVSRCRCHDGGMRSPGRGSRCGPSCGARQSAQVARGEQALGVDQVTSRVVRVPGSRRRGGGSRRSSRSRSNRRSGVHGLFHRQIGQGLKHRARRSFHSLEPLSLVDGRGAHMLGRPSPRRCILQKYAARHSGRPLPVHIRHTSTAKLIFSPGAISALNVSKQCGRLPTSRWLTYRCGGARVRDVRLICGSHPPCCAPTGLGSLALIGARGIDHERQDECACQGAKKLSTAGAAGGFAARRMNFRKKTRAQRRSRASPPAAQELIRALQTTALPDRVTFPKPALR